MNELQIIDQREVLGKDFKIYGDFENPLFLAKDVAEWIEYDVSNVSKMVNNVDENEKIIARINNTSAIFLTEDGLYEVLMLSRKRIAKEFKKQVKQILKTIRKTGMYMTDNVYQAIMNDPTKFGELLINYGKIKKENGDLLLKNKIQEQQIMEMKPKATYYDLILQNPNLLTTRLIASDYGMTANQFNKMLKEYGVQYKQSGIWFLYREYLGYGYTQTKTQPIVRTDGTPDNVPHMYWTQKGRIFLYDFLKKKGVIPVIEQERKGA